MVNCTTFERPAKGLTPAVIEKPRYNNTTTAIQQTEY